MKRFLKNTLFFFLPIIILAFPADYTISYFLKNAHEHPGDLEVMNDIYNRKANCEIAIYGSSRAWVQINSKLIEDSLNRSAYNFGIDGHNFRLQYLRHLEFIKHNNKPNYIIVSVDLLSFQKMQDLYQQSQFLPFMLWNKNITSFTSSYVGFNKADYYIPLIRYLGETDALNLSLKTAFRYAINKQKTPIRYKGFAGMTNEWNSDLENAKAISAEYVVNFDPSLIRLFETFIGECLNNKIELILVYPPEYIEGQHFVSNRDEVINVFKSISTHYNLPFFDYSTDEICFDKSLFYNASHLNKKGADLFTIKLIRDIKTRVHNAARVSRK